MRNLYTLDEYRDQRSEIKAFYGSVGDDTCGVFHVPSKIDNVNLMILAAAGENWDHISVSRRNRCPNWVEMSQVKKLFFYPSEMAVQFHVPEDQHINYHPFTLHLWRPWGKQIDLPPAEFVGPDNLNPEDLKRILQMPPGIFRDLMRKKVYK